MSKEIFTKICENCGEPFDTVIKSKKTCGSECRRLRKIKIVIAIHKTNKIDRRIKLNESGLYCMFCGQKIISDVSGEGRTKSFFCSDEHKKMFHHKKRYNVSRTLILNERTSVLSSEYDYDKIKSIIERYRQLQEEY